MKSLLVLPSFLCLCMYATTVNAQQIAVSASPESQAEASGKTTYTIAVDVSGEFDASVLLRASCATLSGAEFSFSPSIINAPYDQTAKMHVTYVGPVASGDHFIVVEAYNGPLVSRDTCALVVAPRPGSRVFTKENSPLPSNEVRSVVIDKEGVGWIGTDLGLTRFDGTTWTTFDRYNSNLINNGIDFLCIDSSGGIYAGLWEGLVEYKNGNWKTSRPPLVAALAADRNGVIWCAGQDGLYQYLDAIPTIYTPENSDILGGTTYLAFDKNNALWMTAWEGGSHITRYDGIFWTHFSLSKLELDGGYQHQLAADANGDMWVAASNGVVRFKGSQPTVFKSQSNATFPGRSARIISFDNWGACWVGSDEGVGRAENNQFWFYDKNTLGLPEARIKDIKVDSKRTLWIATNQGLILFDASAPPTGNPTAVEEDTVKPLTSVITNVTPHPVTGAAAVHLNLVDDMYVRITLHNNRGAEVAVLCNMVIGKGERQIQFDATDFPIGAYVLRLVAGDIVESRPVIISR